MTIARDRATVRVAPVEFVGTVTLAKAEVFRACQSLADAERVLRASGHRGEADPLWELFELLERRLCGP